MKVVIFDSGTLINLSMNGLLYVLEDLKKVFDGKFVITQSVKQETVDHPLTIQRFELGALQIQDLLDKKVLELPLALGINEREMQAEVIKMKDLANHYLRMRGQWIAIVSEAEVSCIALSTQLMKKGIENMIAIDERTMRMLGENPQNLGKLMSEKLHQPVELVNHNFSAFAPYKFIRSAELVYVAYKKGLIPLKGKKVLEALLYATKFKGCAISFEEIEELKRL